MVLVRVLIVMLVIWWFYLWLCGLVGLMMSVNSVVLVTALGVGWFNFVILWCLFGAVLIGWVCWLCWCLRLRWVLLR